MKLKFAVLVAAIALFGAAPVWAGTLTFDLSNCAEITSPATNASNCPNQDLGTNTATYTVGGVSITAEGFSSSGTGSPNDLYVKNTSGDPSEDGLGLNGTTNDEINLDQYIYLNLSSLAGMNILNGNLTLGSVQTGETGKVCATSAVGTPGSLGCVTYNGTSSAIVTNAVSWTNADDILSITATSGNVLVGQDLTVQTPSPTPEPGTIVLFGLALAGLALVGMSRKSIFAGRQ